MHLIGWDRHGILVKYQFSILIFILIFCFQRKRMIHTVSVERSYEPNIISKPRSKCDQGRDSRSQKSLKPILWAQVHVYYPNLGLSWRWPYSQSVVSDGLSGLPLLQFDTVSLGACAKIQIWVLHIRFDNQTLVFCSAS